MKMITIFFLFCSLLAASFTANAQSTSAQKQGAVKNQEFSIFITDDQQQQVDNVLKQSLQKWQKKRQEQLESHNQGKYLPYFVFSDFISPAIKTKEDYDIRNQAFEKELANADAVGKIQIGNTSIIGRKSIEVYSKAGDGNRYDILLPGGDFVTELTGFPNVSGKRVIHRNIAPARLLEKEEVYYDTEYTLTFDDKTALTVGLMGEEGINGANCGIVGTGFQGRGTPEWKNDASVAIEECLKFYYSFHPEKDPREFQDSLKAIYSLIPSTHATQKVKNILLENTDSACKDGRIFKADKNKCKDAMVDALNVIGEEIILGKPLSGKRNATSGVYR